MKLLTLSAFALVLAPGAFALDAFSNLDPAPNAYQGLTGRVVGVGSIYADLAQGTQFTSGASGVVSGISIAMNQYQSNLNEPKPFTLSLYTSNAQDRIGALLGTYSGLSTGKLSSGTTSALSEVSAGTTSVTLASGTRYWLVARGVGNSSLAWNVSNRTNSVNRVSIPNNDTVYMSSTFSDAFAIRVTPVPEPASFLVLAAGTLALRRRIRRA